MLYNRLSHVHSDTNSRFEFELLHTETRRYSTLMKIMCRRVRSSVRLWPPVLHSLSFSFPKQLDTRITKNILLFFLASFSHSCFLLLLLSLLSSFLLPYFLISCSPVDTVNAVMSCHDPRSLHLAIVHSLCAKAGNDTHATSAKNAGMSFILCGITQTQDFRAGDEVMF